jgi:hypothetical protein
MRKGDFMKYRNRGRNSSGTGHNSTKKETNSSESSVSSAASAANASTPKQDTKVSEPAKQPHQPLIEKSTPKFSYQCGNTPADGLAANPREHEVNHVESTHPFSDAINERNSNPQPVIGMSANPFTAAINERKSNPQPVIGMSAHPFSDALKNRSAQAVTTEPKSAAARNAPTTEETKPAQSAKAQDRKSREKVKKEWSVDENGRTQYDKTWDAMGEGAGDAVKEMGKLENAGNTYMAMKGSEWLGDVIGNLSPELGERIKSDGMDAAEHIITKGPEQVENTGDAVHGLIAGESIENPNAAQSFGKMIGDQIPVVSQLGDFRDMIGGLHAKDLKRTIISASGLIPTGIKGMQNLDEVVETAQKIEQITDVVDVVEGVTGEALSGSGDVIKNVGDFADKGTSVEATVSAYESIMELPHTTENMAAQEVAANVLPDLVPDLYSNSIIESNISQAESAVEISNTFPNNPDELLPEIPRESLVKPDGSTKQVINTSDNVRIRAETHTVKPGEDFADRHHGQHYHVEYKIDPNKSWNNKKNVTKSYPPDYTKGSGTGYLPGERFPGE